MPMVLSSVRSVQPANASNIHTGIVMVRLRGFVVQQPKANTRCSQALRIDARDSRCKVLCRENKPPAMRTLAEVKGVDPLPASRRAVKSTRTSPGRPLSYFSEQRFTTTGVRQYGDRAAQ